MLLSTNYFCWLCGNRWLDIGHWRLPPMTNYFCWLSDIKARTERAGDCDTKQSSILRVSGWQAKRLKGLASAHNKALRVAKRLKATEWFSLCSLDIWGLTSHCDLPFLYWAQLSACGSMFPTCLEHVQIIPVAIAWLLGCVWDRGIIQARQMGGLPMGVWAW
jgi:hypothetical protein